VGVEQVTHQKTVEKTFRYDALQTTISVSVDIFYPQNFSSFQKKGLFQHPLSISLKFRVLSIKSTFLRLALARQAGIELPSIQLCPGVP
jgi:hypothetical protein